MQKDMICKCGSVKSAVTFTCVRGNSCPCAYEYRVNWLEFPTAKEIKHTIWYATRDEAERMSESLTKDGKYVAGISKQAVKK